MEHNHDMSDHDHSMHDMQHEEKSWLKKYAPLIVAFGLVVVWTIARVLSNERLDTEAVMQDFMAGFFIIFGLMKVISWSGFITSFRRYDIFAQKIKYWVPIYPAIELLLGVAFLFRIYPLATNVITLIIMIPASMSVYKVLKRGQMIECACVGSFFTIPLSKFTLFEDLLMVAMSAAMIIRMI